MGSYVNRIKIGDTTHLIEPTLYGTCSTAAATAAKTVTLEGFELQSGVTVAVKFTVTNTAASPTLSINSSDAKAIYYHGSAIAKELLVAKKDTINDIVQGYKDIEENSIDDFEQMQTYYIDKKI